METFFCKNYLDSAEASQTNLAADIKQLESELSLLVDDREVQENPKLLAKIVEFRIACRECLKDLGKWGMASGNFREVLDA